MDRVIQQSVLIRDNVDNVFAALTTREDVAQWWGLINPEADGRDVWFGMDRQWPVPIAAWEDDRLLGFAFDAHHPVDHTRIAPTTLTFSLDDRGNESLLTVVQSSFEDAEWDEAIHDGWCSALLGLKFWVERGLALADWRDESRFEIIREGIAVNHDAWWAWNALTAANGLHRWMGTGITSDARAGGVLMLTTHSGQLIRGSWDLLCEPRNALCSWNNDATGDDLILQWLVLPAQQGSAVTLSVFGLRKRAGAAGKRARKEWQERLAALAAASALRADRDENPPDQEKDRAMPAPIRRTFRFHATPEAVYDAFTDKDDLEAWFAEHAEVDLREGGVWHYTWPGDMEARGRFITLDRPRTLVWTWEESITGPESMSSMVTSTYTIAERDGSAELQIEESGHDSVEIRDMNANGLDQMVDSLRPWLENGTRVDWSQMIMADETRE